MCMYCDLQERQSNHGPAARPIEHEEAYVSNSGHYYVDAVLNHTSGEIYTWAGQMSGGGVELVAPAPGQSVSLTYQLNYDAAGARYGSVQSLTAGEITAIQASLASWSNYANVTFTQVSNNAPDIGFNRGALPDLGGGSYVAGVAHTAVWGNGHIDSSYVWLTNAHVMSYSVGADGYLTALHEIGHALGLKHPGDYNGGGSGLGPFLPGGEDSRDLSIMSYLDGTYAAGALNPSTPMLYDIAAIQYLYGANHAYNSGNTTYTLTGGAKVWAVWDGAGTDTFSSASYSGNVTLDLREGATNISHVGSEHVWVAFGANIENATSGNGNDVLYGNALANVLQGGGGNDTLQGFAGADTLTGGSGTDVYLLATGDGHDTINDSGATDRLNINSVVVTGTATLISGTQYQMVLSGITFLFDLTGSNLEVSISGNMADDWTLSNYTSGYFGITLDVGNVGQTITGNGGAETLTGGGGGDTVSASNGNDSVAAAAGNDSVDGGYGDDTLNGDDGNDTLAGSYGHDVLNGGTGGDSLTGATGNDRLNGDAGNDNLDGGEGDDTFYGGADDDTLSGYYGHDVMNGDDGADSISGYTGNDTIDGGDGNDTIDAGENNDNASGGAGADSLTGGLGNDLLNGDADNDTLVGGTGTDTVNGGSEDDMLYGNAGTDALTGGAGNDTLSGGSECDTLAGGLGNDVFVFGTRTDSGVGVLRDVIADFIQGQDRIDLTGLGAVSYIGGAAFDFNPATFEVRSEIQGGNTVLLVECTGDRYRDLEIQLNGNFVLNGADFV